MASAEEAKAAETDAMIKSHDAKKSAKKDDDGDDGDYKERILSCLEQLTSRIDAMEKGFRPHEGEAMPRQDGILDKDLSPTPPTTLDDEEVDHGQSPWGEGAAARSNGFSDSMTDGADIDPATGKPVSPRGRRASGSYNYDDDSHSLPAG